jgi:hypothetical protein
MEMAALLESREAGNRKGGGAGKSCRRVILRAQIQAICQ